MFLSNLKVTAQIKEFLRFRKQSRNAHGIHSPFLYELYQTAIRGKSPDYLKDNFLQWKKDLSSNKDSLFHEDYGAGSRVLKSPQTTVSKLAKSSTKKWKEASLIARIADYLEAKTLVELGTSFGTTTALLSSSLPDAHIYSMEGSPQVWEHAQRLFESLPLQNIHSRKGLFQDVLPEILDELDKVDGVLFDGHHTKEATLAYFNLVLQKAHSKSFFIFDDIRWSQDMLEAWEAIQKHPRTRLSVDLFHLGLVFINPDLSKQTLCLRY